ncbi:GFA family protein [Aliigemmobacter aestuarii]|uniref:GFA family protein n=1 Tax=Aliigemmobacter aestuarii TaxID=1445661 RepID=A0A4S3MS46_9RHOB|nr:GFA family protein [Gemmobacter aestuarii]THD85368.1 GFA family protein [Gemmobacter aestuarii]
MTGSDLHRVGGCLCGAVRFEATLPHLNFGACHCEMCRRWTGSALLGISVPAENVVWTGEDHIATRQTSGWAKRAWCRDCGSNLWFRVTAPGPYADQIELPIGLLDDAGGLTMTNEIYIDHKPDSFAYAGEGRTVMTRADCVAKFSLLDSE